jgi:copper(I)-binding protein
MRALIAATWVLCSCTPAAGPAAGPAISTEAGAARVLPNGVGAAYLRLLNHGPEADALLGVSSPLARGAELHEVVEEGGLLRMVPHPEGFAVPARGQLALSEGGRHVMLYGVALPPGATGLPLTLHLRRAGEVQVHARLRTLDEALGEDAP